MMQVNEINTGQLAYIDEPDFYPGETQHHFCW
jgi:hypothetical protein